MEFEFVVIIERPVRDVFGFFRDIDHHAGKPKTVVPVYDMITPGPVGLGTRYREVVQMAPFIRWEVISEIISYQPEHCLGYRFSGLGLDGELEYSIEQVASGTQVVQQQSLEPQGILRLFNPIIRWMFSKIAGKRLETIKTILESESS
jgi:hypothetical protein